MKRNGSDRSWEEKAERLNIGAEVEAMAMDFSYMIRMLIVKNLK